MSSVIVFFNRVVVASVQWFADLLYYSEMTDFYISMVFIALAGKFLLKPVFGSAGSDTVSKKRKDVKDDG